MAKKKTTEELLEDISSKLKCITFLIGKQLYSEGNQEDHVGELNKSGFSNNEIALILGTTSDVVRATLSNIRKKIMKGKSDG